MSQQFQPGDFLLFQLEAGYGLLRILAIDETNGEKTWHLAAYENLFMDPESADEALNGSSTLKVSHPHLALTNRAFESAQVARMGNQALNDAETRIIEEWKRDSANTPSDRSVRLLLGLR